MRKLLPIIFIAIFACFVAGSFYHTYACPFINCPYNQLVSKLPLLKVEAISLQQAFILSVLFFSLPRVSVRIEDFQKTYFPRGPPVII